MRLETSSRKQQTQALSRRTLFKAGAAGLVGLAVPFVWGPHRAGAHSSIVTDWTMRPVIKDWLITPASLAMDGEEIYVSGNLDSRIAAMDLQGQITRYYRIEKNSRYDNVCVDVTSQGRVLAASSKGLWELTPSGEARELTRFNFLIDSMAIGPDDQVYVSRKSGWQSSILKLSVDGTMSLVTTVSSNRVSDLAFDASGQLFIADAQRGRILQYSSEEGLQMFMTGFADPSGGGPFYLAFDGDGRLYTASARYGIAMVSDDGTAEPLHVNATGGMLFSRGYLYALQIYSSILYKLNVDGTDVQQEQILLEGDAPWYIDKKGDVVVGERSNVFGRRYYNYYLNDPVRIEPNRLLNGLQQPQQYTLDDAGNVYVLYGGNRLQKITPSGSVKFSLRLPGEFRWDTRLHYSPFDEKLYYFDIGSNSVMRADRAGAETYHTFSSRPDRVSLAPHPNGGVYAGVITSGRGEVLDLSTPGQESMVWRPSSQNHLGRIQLSSDIDGNLYAALGPSFQQVYAIDPTATSIVPQSDGRYDMGFVDPQGFTVLASGEVIVAAPGLLIAFQRS